MYRISEKLLGLVLLQLGSTENLIIDNQFLVPYFDMDYELKSVNLLESCQ